MKSPAAVAAAGLAALALAMGVGRFAFTPILPMMQADGGLTLAAGGWLATVNYAGYLAGSLTATMLRGSLAIRAGLLAIALGTLAMGLVQSFPAWLVLRTVAGVASAWVLIHVSAWALRQLAPLGRPVFSGAVYAGVGIGIVAVGLACLGLMALHSSAAAAWVVMGVASLAGTAALWAHFDAGALRPVPHAHGAHARGESIRLILCYGAYGFGYIVPATFLPAMARAALGDSTLFGWAWPAFGLAAVIATFAATPLVRHHGGRAVWIGSQLVMALGVAAPLVVAGMPGILLAALCVGSTFVVITMVALEEGRQIGDARLIAQMTAAFALGQIAGPALVSLLAQGHAGIARASLAACVLLVASSAALLKRRRTAPRRASAAPER